jgi:hypothetical protein
MKFVLTADSQSWRGDSCYAYPSAVYVTPHYENESSIWKLWGHSPDFWNCNNPNMTRNLLLARSTNRNVLSNVLRMVGIHDSRNPNEIEWHYLTMMVVVMNFEHHHLDGATNITVLTDHQTLKGCLTPNLNERQTHRLISFYPTIFTFHWKGALMIHSILGDQTIQSGHKVDAWKAWYTTSSEPWNELFVLVWKAKGFLSSPALPLRAPVTKNVWTTSPEELEIDMWPPSSHDILSFGKRHFWNLSLLFFLFSEAVTLLPLLWQSCHPR